MGLHCSLRPVCLVIRNFHDISGGDDRRVLVWQVEKMLSDIGSPAVMKGEHNSNIFCIAFDLDNKTAFSGGR